MQYIKLGKRVIEARWDVDESKWDLKVKFLPSQTFILNKRNANTSNLD
jgi:hypothetical protein